MTWAAAPKLMSGYDLGNSVSSKLSRRGKRTDLLVITVHGYLLYLGIEELPMLCQPLKTLFTRILKYSMYTKETFIEGGHSTFETLFEKRTNVTPL